MAKIVNIKNEQNKKELKTLLEQVNIDNTETDLSQLGKFEKAEEEYKQSFIKRFNIDPNDDKEILYKICDILKTKRKIDFDACWASCIASNIVMELSAKAETTVKNDFFYKRCRALKDANEEEKLKYLIKHRKYWLSEIQEALDTNNYNLLKNSNTLLMIYSSEALNVYYDLET